MKRTVLLPMVVLSLISPNLFAADTSYNSKASTDVINNKHEKMSSDAIEIILQDHAHIRKMFAELDTKLESNVAESRSMFKDLKKFIVNHETMEQKDWYPALEKYADLMDIIAALKKEESDASKAIKKLEGIKDDKEWVKQIKAFKNDVEHHASEEETKLFPKVKELVDKNTLNTIGAKLLKYHAKNNMKG